MFEFQVKLLVGKLLMVVREAQIADDAIVAAAFADCVGAFAATQDRTLGGASLADRMHSFDARVRETYRRVRDTIETAGLKVNVPCS